MISRESTGFSSDSPSAALSQALTGVFSSDDYAATVQVIVKGVTKVGRGWYASVLTLIEPKPVNGLKKNGPQLDENQKEENQKEENKRKRREELGHQLKLEHDFEALKHVQDIQKARELEEEDAIYSLYMDLAFENVFHPIAPFFNFDYVHYVPDGPLWNEVLRHHPHLDMYEAAHDLDSEPDLESKPSPRLSSKRAYRKGMKPRVKLAGEVSD